MFHGAVEFRAVYQHGAWHVMRFTLPNTGWTLKVNDKGVWKKTDAK